MSVQPLIQFSDQESETNANAIVQNLPENNAHDTLQNSSGSSLSEHNTGFLATNQSNINNRILTEISQDIRMLDSIFVAPSTSRYGQNTHTPRTPTPFYFDDSDEYSDATDDVSDTEIFIRELHTSQIQIYRYLLLQEIDSQFD